MSAARVDDALAKAGKFLAARLLGGEAGELESLAACAILHTPAFAGENGLALRLASSLRDASWIRAPKPVQAAAWRILAVEAAGDPLLRPIAADAARFLVLTQGRGGLWSATSRVDLAVEPWGLPAVLVLGGRPLEAPRPIDLARRGPPPAEEGDLATTELALYALAAAERTGAKAPRACWEEAARGLAALRDRSTGGWGASTASGLAGYALASRQIGEAPGAAIDAAAWRASTDLSLSAARWASLERAAAALRSPFLHDLEWHPAGAKALLDLQRPDGAWDQDGDPVAATSAAVLFLARSTARGMDPLRGGEGALETRALASPLHVFVVLDASGWMRQDLDGRERFEVAKDVVAKIAESLPAGATFGLRVFGARSAATEAEADVDTHLVVEPGPVNAAQLRGLLGGLRVKGKSPLSVALLEAAKDLARVPPEVEMTTLLLVDGRDSDRKADPAAAAAELAGSRKGMPLHVVGFNLDDDEIQERLGRMARAGGGRFLKAAAAEGLSRDVLGALKRSDAYVLFGADGKEVARGVLGDRRVVPAGTYAFAPGDGSSGSRRAIWIQPGLPTLVLVDPMKLSR